MIRLDETGVGHTLHASVLAYEVALLQEHIDSLSKTSGFSASVCKAVQAYLLDRIEIVGQEGVDSPSEP